MKIEIKKYFFVLAVLCLLLLAGCSQVVVDDNVNDGVKDESLTKIKEEGVLVFGIDPNFPPMRLIDESGNLVGFDIDVAMDIASGLGVDIEIKQMPWGQLFDNVKQGSVDVIISAITITPERQTQMLFSVPYFEAGQVLLVKDVAVDITEPDDLKGKNVGVLKGTTCEEVALQYANSGLTKSYDEYDSLISDLKEGIVDVIVADLIGASGFVKENPGLKIVGEPFSQEYYGIATKLGNVALMDEVNLMLRDMKRNGRLDEIKEKWLN